MNHSLETAATIALLFLLKMLILNKKTMKTTHKDKTLTATPVKERNLGPFATAREASEAKNGELWKRISKMDIKEFVKNH